MKNQSSKTTTIPRQIGHCASLRTSIKSMQKNLQKTRHLTSTRDNNHECTHIGQTRLESMQIEVIFTQDKDKSLTSRPEHFRSIQLRDTCERASRHYVDECQTTLFSFSWHIIRVCDFIMRIYSKLIHHMLISKISACIQYILKFQEKGCSITQRKRRRKKQRKDVAECRERGGERSCSHSKLAHWPVLSNNFFLTAKVKEITS